MEADFERAWPKVRAALADPRWDFRTVDGIVEETRLPREHVKAVLGKHGTMVRRAVSRRKRSRGWRFVYTLKSRPRKRIREFLSDVLTFASQ